MKNKSSTFCFTFLANLSTANGEQLVSCMQPPGPGTHYLPPFVLNLWVAQVPQEPHKMQDLRHARPGFISHAHQVHGVRQNGFQLQACPWFTAFTKLLNCVRLGFVGQTHVSQYRLEITCPRADTSSAASAGRWTRTASTPSAAYPARWTRARRTSTPRAASADAWTPSATTPSAPSVASSMRPTGTAIRRAQARWPGRPSYRYRHGARSIQRGAASLEDTRLIWTFQVHCSHSSVITHEHIC